MHARSKDYGSPNHRSRAYGLGGRTDVCDERQFRACLDSFLDKLPVTHRRASIFDCWAYVVRNRLSQTILAPSKDVRGLGFWVFLISSFVFWTVGFPCFHFSNLGFSDSLFSFLRFSEIAIFFFSFFGTWDFGILHFEFWSFDGPCRHFQASMHSPQNQPKCSRKWFEMVSGQIFVGFLALPGVERRGCSLESGACIEAGGQVRGQGGKGSVAQGGWIRMVPTEARKRGRRLKHYCRSIQSQKVRRAITCKGKMKKHVFDQKPVFFIQVSNFPKFLGLRAIDANHGKPFKTISATRAKPFQTISNHIPAT